MKKRISIFLVLVLLLGMLPLGTAMAAYQAARPGFFTQPVHDSQYYTEEFHYDGAYAVTNDVYLVVPAGYTMHNTTWRNTGVDWSRTPNGNGFLIHINGFYSRRTASLELSYSLTDDNTGQTVNDVAHLDLVNDTKQLYYREAAWNQSTRQYEPYPGNPCFTGTLGYLPGGTRRVEFLYFDGTDMVQVPFDNLQFSGSSLNIQHLGRNIVFIDGDFGPGTVTDTAHGISMPLLGQINGMGFFTSPTALDAAHWMYNRLDYDGTNGTCYFTAPGTMSNVREEGSNSGATLTPSQDGHTVTIEFTSAPLSGQLKLCFDYVTPEGRTENGRRWDLRINDVAPGLLFRPAKWDQQTESYVENTNRNPGRGRINGSPDCWGAFEFFFRDAQRNVTPVPAGSLGVTGSVCTVSVQSGNITKVSFEEFGSGTITYQGYSLVVRGILPDQGFYSAPQRTEANYVSAFNYEGPARTLYFMAQASASDLVFSQASSSNSMIDAVIGGSGAYIEVSPADPSVSAGGMLTWDGADGNGNPYSNRNGIRFIGKRILSRWVFEPSTQNKYLGDLYDGIGRNTGAIEYIRPMTETNGRYAPFAGTLTSQDPSIVSVSLYDANEHIWKLEFHSPASTFITANDGGQDRCIFVGTQSSKTLPTGYEYLKFQRVILPHSDYLADYGGFGGIIGDMVGETVLYQFILSDSGTPLPNALTYDANALTVAPFAAAGLQGVYSVEYKAAGEYVIAYNEYATVVRSNAQPERFTLANLVLEKTPAKAATETENGNIEYYTDQNSGKIYKMPAYSFAADHTMTRADMAQFICAALGWNGQPSGTNAFSDVPASHAAYREIMMVCEQRLMAPYADGTFKPDLPVTRAEAAVLMVRIFQAGGMVPPTIPTDVAQGDWFYDAVCTAVTLGFLPPRTDGTFAPQDQVVFGDFNLDALLSQTGYQEITPSQTVIPATGGGGYDPGPSGTTPTTNTDGSKTETTTNDDGSKTETTTNTDGSKTAVTTNTDGSKIETNTAADGSTGEVKTDADGKVTEASAAVSEKAAAEAGDEAVTLQVELPAAENTAEAAPLQIEVPEAAGSVTVEIPVTDVDANSVVVLVHEDGTEEVLPKVAMTDKGLAVEVSGNVTVKIVDNAQSFNDMPADPEQAEAIQFVSSRGMMNGVGNDSFAPEEPMTRGMITTVLYRMERKPDAPETTSFADVSGEEWYSDAVAWAAEAGIVEGYGDEFGVNDSVTNEQIVVMLWRMAGKPEAAAVESGASSWATAAMNWAIGAGLIDRSATGANAGAPATRGQVSAMVMRFINL